MCYNQDMHNLPESLERRMEPLNIATSAVGPGWFPLVESLDAAIGEIAPDYMIIQVKQKFAELRYYIQLSLTSADVSERVHALIREAELKSRETCEVCGTGGSVNNGYRVRCSDHADKLRW